jgi:hypothetical protein
MRTFKLENAKQDADFWSHMHDMQTATIEDHKGLIATAERGVAKGETGRAEAAVCVLMRLHEEFKRCIKTQTIPPFGLVLIVVVVVWLLGGVRFG